MLSLICGKLNIIVVKCNDFNKFTDLKCVLMSSLIGVPKKSKHIVFQYKDSSKLHILVATKV